MPRGRPQLFDINSSVLNLILNTFALKYSYIKAVNPAFLLSFAALIYFYDFS